ncbi:hypothetical protein [Fusobacterium polymorphum]|uniref:hypothetical protein n=1 Tax=Fusobacterium nucleatum subsp. polymorphum TaxID=76857 RepID=UPI00072179EE|nr:hypothetical protein [Fusobacterium polymorphum]ALQ41782.1 hypothetical protein RN93_02965 [Fusobacterium polymorphum]
MNEFNEFIVKISEIRKYMFLTLVFLFLMLPVICTILVITKSKNENKEDKEDKIDFILGKFTWILIFIGFYILLREFIYF